MKNPVAGIGRGALEQAVYSNTYKTIVPNLNSTGLQLHSSRWRAALGNSHTSSAEEFLLNTRLRRVDRESELSVEWYFSDSQMVMCALSDLYWDDDSSWIELPRPSKCEMCLGEALDRRKSSRQFTEDHMSVADLSCLLGIAFGYSRDESIKLGEEEADNILQRRYKRVPSGGGLYPVRAVMALSSVDQIASGIYDYDPHRNRVHLVPGGSLERLYNGFAVQQDMISFRRANCTVLLVANIWRSMRKYGDRGLRYVFIETGEIAMTLHLAAAALGYGSLDCASLYDDEVHEAVCVDGQFETLTHAVLIGSIP
jgi:SagB-type dehydrogenase family enzyme